MRSLMLVVLIAALSACGSAWAQVEVNMPMASGPGTAQPTDAVASSFIGQITGNDVFVRSGPATTFYQCGKLYEGDQVSVVDSRDGWSCITPPPGCFSWVAMQYVSINLENPTMGIVTGDNVSVYAGSDFVEPMHSTTRQVTLKRGQTVKLLNEEKDEYYKIAPPQGAYLWVSSQYVQPVQATVEETPVAVEPVEGTPEPTQAVETARTVQPRNESEFLDAYYAMSKLVKEQQAKPLAEQEYTAIKEQLTKLAENEAAGRAARYAEFTLQQVERFELARVVAKEIAMQKEELQNVNEKIDEARTARLAEIEDLGRFAVIGKLENSSLYANSLPTGMARRYRILDESGKTICYVSPKGAAAGRDLSGLIGRKVGLVGDIRPHEATARAFVEFSDIVPLD